MIQNIQNILQIMEFKELEVMFSRQKNETLLNIKVDLEENEKVLMQTQSKINEIFGQFSKEGFIPNVSYINLYEILIQRENCFGRNLLFIEEKDGFNQLLFWTTKEYRDTLENDLDQLNKNDPSFTPPKIVEITETSLKPPTCFKTNAFSESF